MSDYNCSYCLEPNNNELDNKLIFCKHSHGFCKECYNYLQNSSFIAKKDFVCTVCKQIIEKYSEPIKNGLVVEFNSKGKIETMSIYVNNEIQGLQFVWNKDLLTIKNGSKVIKQFYPNGNLAYSADEPGTYNTYKSGKIASKYTNRFYTTWYTSGQIEKEAPLLEGTLEKHGTVTEWYESGQVKSTKEYEYNNPCGWYIHYDTDGKILSEWFYDGSMDDDTIWSYELSKQIPPALKMMYNHPGYKSIFSKIKNFSYYSEDQDQYEDKYEEFEEKYYHANRKKFN